MPGEERGEEGGEHSLAAGMNITDVTNHRVSSVEEVRTVTPNDSALLNESLNDSAELTDDNFDSATESPTHSQIKNCAHSKSPPKSTRQNGPSVENCLPPKLPPEEEASAVILIDSCIESADFNYFETKGLAGEKGEDKIISSAPTLATAATTATTTGEPFRVPPQIGDSPRTPQQSMPPLHPVSYTHLTLPTIYSV